MQSQLTFVATYAIIIWGHNEQVISILTLNVPIKYILWQYLDTSHMSAVAIHPNLSRRIAVE